VTSKQRLAQALAQLLRRDAGRPRLVTLYLEEVDGAGHAHGPTSPELADAVSRADAAVGRLVAGIDRAGLAATTDVVVVSDHGMAEVAAGHQILLDTLVDVRRARVVAWSPVLELWPAAADVEPVLAKLRGAHPHLAVFRREELPARLHYAGSDRIPPIVALADEGWGVTTRDRAGSGTHGEHGYDPALPSMAALFVAAGPSFARGRELPAFDNVAVYPLLCAALGIAPLPGDWSSAALPDALARPAVTAPIPTRPTRPLPRSRR
jgi:predicted AlkP superfamily pyrophosphatase or phosphodiesterase